MAGSARADGDVREPPQWRTAPRAHTAPQRTRFFNQKMEQKEPEKKMPSTEANAMRRSANVARSRFVHRSAHAALRATQGTVSSALNRNAFSARSVMYVSISRE